jgi:riboflavin biosynthesis pyrimidine reductase/predicted DsbA family dithiol-disulfide isomerase
MSLVIPVAHDFICPWCWVGLFQAKKLQLEFGAKIDWRGYELFPKDMDWPDSPPSKDEAPANKPATPTRFALLVAAEGMEYPTVPRPYKMRTYNAHQAVEYAKTEGVEDELIERLYRALWEQGREINDPKVIHELAVGLIENLDAMHEAIRNKSFANDVVDFDEPAFSKGVYNVPTFFIGSERLAEQPYVAIKKAVLAYKANLNQSEIYSDLVFPQAPKNRPYTFINMVTTIDGKILSGERNEPVCDLGSNLDHLLMHRLESKSDAILVGATSLRASGINWNPKTRKRIVVTSSGNLPWESEFLSKGEPIVLVSGSKTISAPSNVKIIRAGGQTLDWKIAFELLRANGVHTLNVLGGSEINAQVLENNLVDELFMTLAPKIKLGRDVPTYADGNALPRHALQQYDLVEHHAVNNELFLRYRRKA